MHKDPILKLFLAALITFASVCVGLAATLGPDRFDSHRDLRLNSTYGTLFFNEGAIRTHGFKGSRQLKRFVRITGTGTINLPKQDGYCFLLNHFVGHYELALPHKYFVKIVKIYSDNTRTEEKVSRSFTQASHLSESVPPDICINRIRGVRTLELTFGSTDGREFDWFIKFDHHR